MRRPGWFVRTVATSSISCTAKDWVISASVVAYEGETEIFRKIFEEKRVARDLM
jgi:hypothetical protein